MDRWLHCASLPHQPALLNPGRTARLDRHAATRLVLLHQLDAVVHVRQLGLRLLQRQGSQQQLLLHLHPNRHLYDTDRHLVHPYGNRWLYWHKLEQ